MSAPEPRQTLERALARARRAGACAADAQLVESDALEARVRDREIDHVSQAREHSLGLRAFVRAPGGLRSALGSTSDLSDAAVDRLADEVVALAGATAPDPDAGLPRGGFADDLPDLALLDPADRAAGAEARIADARRCEAAARAVDPRISNSEGSDVSARFARTAYANSEGFHGEYESAQHSLFCMPIASENGSMQADWWACSARSLAGLEAPEAVGRRAAERALRRLGATRAPTCEVPVIFEPMTARSVIGHVAACVSGSAVHRKASYLAGRLGETVASEKVTVHDDARLPGGLASRPFDAEGLCTRRTTVIERGRLASYLLDSYAARKLGLASTGSARGGPASGLAAGSSNFYLEPGDATLESMIAGTERGLLVTWMFGQGFNPVTGDFSRGAAGLWIEDGRPTGFVEELTVAGSLAGILGGIDAVGSDLVWIGATASPSFRVARMTVAGK